MRGEDFRAGRSPRVETRMMTQGYMASLRGPVEAREDRCLRRATIQIVSAPALGKSARFMRDELRPVALYVT